MRCRANDHQIGVRFDDIQQQQADLAPLLGIPAIGAQMQLLQHLGIAQRPGPEASPHQAQHRHPTLLFNPQRLHLISDLPADGAGQLGERLRLADRIDHHRQGQQRHRSGATVHQQQQWPAGQVLTSAVRVGQQLLKQQAQANAHLFGVLAEQGATVFGAGFPAGGHQVGSDVAGAISGPLLFSQITLSLTFTSCG